MAKVQNEMATRITVNTVEAANSMKALRDAVTANTNAWKAMETAQKSAGNYQAAAAERMNGLNRTIELQKQRIEELRQRQSGLDQSTQDGARNFIKLEKQISQANKQLASYQAQADRAKSSYQYQASGLAELQRGYKTAQEQSRAYVDRLKAEHKTASASLADYKGLSNGLKNLHQQYAIQADMLKKVEAESGKTSSAYAKQKQQLDQTGQKVAETSDKLKNMQSTINRLQPTGIKRIDDAVVTAKDHAAQMGVSLKRGYESAKARIMAASASAVAFGTVLVNGAKQASTLQKSYVEVTNLAVQGGERQAAVQKAVNQMYADGRKYSIQYGVSQHSIADGYEELIKRGYDTKEALGSMRAILQASKASGDEFDDTMRVTTSTLEQFGMRGKTASEQMANTAKVANSLAMAADKTSTSFSDIGIAMTYAGQTAHSSGISLDQTATILGVLSNNALEGSEAGTGLQRVITRLQAPTDAAREALNQYGISMDDFKDKSGKLKSIPDIFDQINKAVPESKRLEVFNTVFGQTGQNAANIISENTKAIRENQSAVANAYKNDYVSKLANKNMKATQNATAQFREAAKAIQIDLGTQLMPVIAKAAKQMASALNQKSTQNGIKELGKMIAGVTNVLINMVTFLGKHTTTVKVFGAALGSAFVVFKTLTIANNIRRVVTELGLLGKAAKVASVAVKGISVATKLASAGLQGLGKVAKIAGIGLKGGLVVGGILLVTTALVALYKHNKKFRNFVNGLAKDAQKAMKATAKWFSNGFKAVKKSIDDGIKKSQKSWNNFAKATSKVTSNLWKNTKKVFADGWKNLQTYTRKGVNGVEKEHNQLNRLADRAARQLFKQNEATFRAGYKVIGDQTRTWRDLMSGHWDRLDNDTRQTTRDMRNFQERLFSGLYDKLNDMTGGRLGEMLKTFQRIFGSIQDAVGNAVGAVHRRFVDLVNGVLRPFKTLISNIKGGINWILDKIGASKLGGDFSIFFPSYANGTDDTHPGGFAKVNDAKTAHYREMYRLPNGKVGMFPAVRDMIVPLPKGTSILDGERSYKLATMLGMIPHYADGIGDFFAGVLSKAGDVADSILENVDKIIAHPVEFAKSVFDRFVNQSSPIKFAQALITNVPAYIAKQMGAWIKKQFETLADPGGSGVARWRPYVMRALKMLGLSEGLVGKVLRQIQTESNGNPKALGGDDGLSDGRAMGLMQVKPPTFNAYKVPGHNNIWNGFDNLLAGLNYAKHRYGSDLYFLGQGHGYADGGLISQHGVYEIAEKNLPEYVIPTDINKRSRAYQLLGEVVTRFRAEDQVTGRLGQENVGSNGDLDALNRKFDVLLSMFKELLQLSGNQVEAIKAQGTFDTQSFYKKQARDLRMQQLGLGR